VKSVCIEILVVLSLDRNIQASHADSTSLFRPEMACHVVASLHGRALGCAEDIPPHLEAAPFFGTSVPRRNFLEFPRLCKSHTQKRAQLTAYD
jgi:hypothetical protein